MNPVWPPLGEPIHVHVQILGGIVFLLGAATFLFSIFAQMAAPQPIGMYSIEFYGALVVFTGFAIWAVGMVYELVVGADHA